MEEDERTKNIRKTLDTNRKEVIIVITITYNVSHCPTRKILNIINTQTTTETEVGGEGREINETIGTTTLNIDPKDLKETRRGIPRSP